MNWKKALKKWNQFQMILFSKDSNCCMKKKYLKINNFLCLQLWRFWGWCTNTQWIWGFWKRFLDKGYLLSQISKKIKKSQCSTPKSMKTYKYFIEEINLILLEFKALYFILWIIVQLCQVINCWKSGSMIHWKIHSLSKKDKMLWNNFCRIMIKLMR